MVCQRATREKLPPSRRGFTSLVYDAPATAKQSLVETTPVAVGASSVRQQQPCMVVHEEAELLVRH